MTKARTLCMWCDEPAIRYCDAVVAFRAVEFVRVGSIENNRFSPLMGMGKEGDEVMWTCDAPMCAAHTKQVGWVSGKEPDSFDHCPYHVGRSEKDTPITLEHEALELRRLAHAEIRRGRFAAVGGRPL